MITNTHISRLKINQSNWQLSAIVSLFFLFFSSLSLATAMQEEQLNFVTQETEKPDETIFEDIVSESEAVNFDEILQKHMAEDTSSADVVTEISKEIGKDDHVDSEDLSAEQESIQVVDLEKQPGKHVSLGDLTDIEPGSGLFFLVEPLADDPELREAAKEVITTVQDIQEMLLADEITYIQTEEELTENLDTSLYELNQAQTTFNEQYQLNGVKKNGIDKKNFDHVAFEEFKDKLKLIALYLIIGLILIKFIIFIISRLKKLKQRSDTSNFVK